MIVTQTKNDEVVKSQDFESRKFSITESGKNKLFKLLVMNLYQDINKSLIREITCNAIDANKESGTTKNAELEYIPKNSLLGQEEILIIRDYGIGISPERMWDTFINLGESTKDTSNDFIGGFGIGCKTIFAYSDNTMIVTVNNGIRYTYIACINEFDEPEMNLISKQETEMPSGTEVYIMIKSWYDMQRSINSELYYLQEKITFINYKPDFKDLQIYYENDNLVYNTYDSEFHVILGGIKYDIPLLNDRTKTPYGRPELNLSVGLKFNVGELSPTPSRESLRWDSKSEQLVVDRIASAKIEIVENYIKPKLSGATSFIERYKINQNTNLERLISDKEDFDLVPYKKYHFKKSLVDDYFQYKVYKISKKIKYYYFKPVDWSSYLLGNGKELYYTNDINFVPSKDLANTLKSTSAYVLVKQDVDVSKLSITQLKAVTNTLRLNSIFYDELSTFAKPIEDVVVIPLITAAKIRQQYQKKAAVNTLTEISVRTMYKKDTWDEQLAFRNHNVAISSIPGYKQVVYGNQNDDSALIRLGTILRYHSYYSMYGRDFLKNIVVYKINSSYNKLFSDNKNCIHIKDFNFNSILYDYSCYKVYSDYKYILDIDYIKYLYPDLQNIYDRAILIRDTYGKFDNETLPEVKHNLEEIKIRLQNSLIPYLGNSLSDIPVEILNNYLKTILNESTNQLLSNTDNN